VWKRLSEKKKRLTLTAVAECNNCHGLLLIPLNQKTKTCPYCGSKVELRKAKRLATAQDSFEASEIIKKLKATRKNNPSVPQRIHKQKTQ
jgi:RNA polymerase subunit RPABC4/transcription elongation factor Spt4